MEEMIKVYVVEQDGEKIHYKRLTEAFDALTADIEWVTDNMHRDDYFDFNIRVEMMPVAQYDALPEV